MILVTKNAIQMTPENGESFSMEEIEEMEKLHDIYYAKNLSLAIWVEKTEPDSLVFHILNVHQQEIRWNRDADVSVSNNEVSRFLALMVRAQSDTSSSE